MSALDGLRGQETGSVDLVFTSPPAYPSMLQEPGALGTEPTLTRYLDNLHRHLLAMRRVIRIGGFLVLVVQPVPGYNLLTPLANILRGARYRMLTTIRWSHGDGTASWVIFLGKGPAQLNRSAEAWNATEWAMPRPGPDTIYNFWEWPAGLVAAVIDMTIPKGGRVMDPFAGKAQALSLLPPAYDVVAVDVMNFDTDSGTLASESRPTPVANEVPGGRGPGAPGLAGGAA